MHADQAFGLPSHLLLLRTLHAALVEIHADEEGHKSHAEHEEDDEFSVIHLSVLRRKRESETAMAMNATSESQGSSMP